MRNVRFFPFSRAGIILLLCSLSHASLIGQPDQGISTGSGGVPPPLIPTPRTVEWGAGHFTIAQGLTIRLSNEKSVEDRFAADQLSEEIRAALGFQPGRSPKAKGKHILLGRIGDSREVTRRLGASRMSLSDSLGREGYVLQVDRKAFLSLRTLARACSTVSRRSGS